MQVEVLRFFRKRNERQEKIFDGDERDLRDRDSGIRSLSQLWGSMARRGLLQCVFVQKFSDDD